MSHSSWLLHAPFLAPALLPFLLLLNSGHVVDNPPVAVDDAYQVHGSTQIGNLLANDFDPDGDPIAFGGYGALPQHGRLIDGPSAGTPFYQPNLAYTGSDNFTYRVCQGNGLCSGYATVTLTISNQAPAPADDSFRVHGQTLLADFLLNDSDPDGDPIRFNGYINRPQHGRLIDGPALTTPFYQPNAGYVGSDSFSYEICDSFGLCGVAVGIITVANQSPSPGSDQYDIRGQTQLTSFLSNDSDPDGDSFSCAGYVSPPQHGRLIDGATLSTPIYAPSPGFSGTDSFTYRICDNLGLCGDGSVSLFVLGDCEDCGATSCELSAGEPVNVASGNMYIQQSDYQLASVGYGVGVARTYNSDSQVVGLFGRGWSSQYDQSIVAYDASLARFNQSDGRAIYFARIGATFSPREADVHTQLTDGNGFTVTLKDGSFERFNLSGKLLSIADRTGNTTSLSYDVNGHLSSIRDPFGRTLVINTDANGLVTSISDALGAIATYNYGSSQELLSVTYADNSAFNFTYDGNLRLIRVTDALANVIESHTYDGSGRATSSEQHGGVDDYSFNYVSDSETDVTDGLGRLTKYTFERSKGRSVVTRVEGLCGCGGNSSQIQTWTYDDQLNVSSRTDALGHLRTYSYDANGNRLTQTDPTGTITYTYNGFGEVSTRTDQMTNLTSNTYDGLGNLLVSTDALNNPTTFTYNAQGQILTATDARGKVTAFVYDANGNLTQRRDANSITTFFFYDGRGRLTKVRDGLSRSSLFAYDAAGRISKVTHADNSFVSFTYDLAGRRTRVIDERGNVTSYGYDGAYRLTSITDALNHETTFGYDLMSNLTSMTDALSRTTNYDYDEFNRLTRTTYPPATVGAVRLFETVSYDGDGNVISQTDTASRVTNYAYDNVNRLMRSTDASGKTTAFEYDLLGRVVSVNDPIDQQYQLAYDALGRETQVSRGGVSMSFVYDEVGNRTQRTDYNGVVTNYSYDSLNRLTTITYPTRTATFSYDPLNNLTRTQNENGTIYLAYDNRYRLASVSDPFYYGIRYNYDSAGNRTKLKVNGATFATYTYDAANRLTSLADGSNLNFTYTYDAVNRLISRNAPNGITTSHAYDDLGRLTSLMHASGTTTLNGNVYTYTSADNLSSWTTQTAQRVYTYDSVDQLTGVANFELPVESYAYDAVGNRTASHLSVNYSYQPSNQLVSTASSAYTYDHNGNMTSRTDAAGLTSFAFNEENQLTRVTLPNGLAVDYKYDGLGRRIQRTTSSGADERYVYDGPDALIDLNSNWSVATTYLNDLGIDNHLRQTNATTGSSYFLTDHLGSTAAFADANGNLVEQISYDSFGNGAASGRSRYGFAGRERDPDTGLLYNRARFYDPQIGRFISEDPLGLAGGLNAYAYTRNNPLTRKDPSGLYDIDVHYYLTYYLAMATGCFQSEEARLIAEGDQHSDEDENKKPGWGMKWKMSWGRIIAVPFPEQQKRNVDFHAFGTHEQNTRRAAELLAQATSSTGGFWQFGTYLHFLQDSYSHWDFAGYSVWGQTTGGKSVDHTNFAPGKARDMAHSTYDEIRRFAEIRGCRCHGNPDWNLIDRFIDVGYDLSTPSGRAADFTRDVSDDQLRNKIGILNVPWRSANGR